MRQPSSAPPAGARCGRCLLGLGPRCGWASRSTAPRSAAAPGLSQPGTFRDRHFPRVLPRSRSSRPYRAGSQTRFLTTANLTAANASPTQPSAAAIGPRWRGRAWRSAPPTAAPGAGATAIGCGLRQSRIWAPRPTGLARGRPRPARSPAPPPSGAGSPPQGGLPHSLSRSLNCQSAPGGC